METNLGAISEEAANAQSALESIKYLVHNAETAQALAQADGSSFIRMNPDGTLEVMSVADVTRYIAKRLDPSIL